MKHYDAVVIGAGAVGASCALGLAKQGHEVALVEASAESPSYSGEQPYDLRVFAISYASEQLFRHIGAWDAIQAKRLCSYTDMQVWDQGGAGSIHFGCEDIDRDHLGCIIENNVIVASLHECVAQHARIDYLSGERLGQLTLPEAGSGDRVTLQLEQAGDVSADLVVAADGANSQTRALAGIAVEGQSYEQLGIVAVVKTELPHQNTAWQRFVDTGPIAFLPLTDGSCSIVWSADQPYADELLALDDQAFADRLAAAFEFKLGAVAIKSQRVAFPLRHQHADEYTLPGLALVGDAAHVIHPLAGQGVNLGLLDVATLLDELGGPKPLGAITPLRRYARRRRHANQLSLSAMTALNHVFKNDLSAYQQLRNRGMQAAGDIALLRRQFALRAAGLEGDVPQLS